MEKAFNLKQSTAAPVRRTYPIQGNLPCGGKTHTTPKEYGLSLPTPSVLLGREHAEGRRTAGAPASERVGTGNEASFALKFL